MKHLRTLSFLSALLLAVGTFGFIACSQDEAEDTPTKAEILKAKAKEFAKKYGVQMSLNEENIEQIAETLTVEQMEEDFQAFAEFQGETTTNDQSTPHRTKGLKINRTKALVETTPPVDHDPYAGEREKERKGSVTDYAEVQFLHGTHHHQCTFQIDVSWDYNPRASDKNKVDVRVSESSGASVTTDISGYFYPGDEGHGDNIEAHGTLKLSTGLYVYTFSFSFHYNTKSKVCSTSVA